jgi:class 3 adenylate cyclase
MDSLSIWLGELGLERYAAVFEANGVDWESLPLLTERDLSDLGVLLGHRRRLLDALSRPQSDVALEAPRPSRAHRPPGERRQLTVLYCDLSGSTELAQRLDAGTDALRRSRFRSRCMIR